MLDHVPRHVKDTSKSVTRESDYPCCTGYSQFFISGKHLMVNELCASVSTRKYLHFFICSLPVFYSLPYIDNHCWSMEIFNGYLMYSPAILVKMVWAINMSPNMFWSRKVTISDPTSWYSIFRIFSFNSSYHCRGLLYLFKLHWIEYNFLLK